MNALAALQIFDPVATISELAPGGVAAIEAAPASPRGTLLYFHGGGYRLGEAGTWAGLASRIATAARVTVIVPDYRLAPEHPFPGALHDAMTVYHAVCAAETGPIFVGGDSAGGGLACSLVATLSAASGVIPAGILLVSPWLDLTPDAPSFDRCAETDTTFSRTAAVAAARHYLQNQDPRHPLLTPLQSDLAHFPPSFIAASATEVLIDQALELASSLGRAGRPFDLRVEADCPHAWPILQPAAPETASLIAAMASFIARHGSTGP